MLRRLEEPFDVRDAGPSIAAGWGFADAKVGEEGRECRDVDVDLCSEGCQRRKLIDWANSSRTPGIWIGLRRHIAEARMVESGL